MARKVIDYSDFTGGEYGILEPWRAPPGSWTGKNIVQYDNGSLGPRNGLIEVGLSTAVTGSVLSAGPYGRRTNSDVWVILDNAGVRTAKTITAAGVVSSVTAVSAIPVVYEPVSSLVEEDEEYLCFVDSGIYHLTGGNFTAVPSTPSGRCFIKHGDRFYVGGGIGTGYQATTPAGTDSPATRLWYSAVDDITSWPSLNYIDVTGAIVGLFSQRSHLVIVTTEGWYILTGVPGITDTLRRQNKSEFPTWPTQATVVEPSCNLAFVHGSLQQRDGEDEGEIAVHSLGVFTAATIEYASHLPFGSGQNYTTYPPTYQAVTLRGPEDLLVQGGVDTAPNRAMLYRNKGWQKIEWAVASTTLLGWCMSMRRTDRHQFLSHNGANVRMFEWRAYNNRPAFASDTTKQPGDDSTTPFVAEFTLPEHHEEAGTDIGLVDIVVDFTSWDTGAATTNHFEIVPYVLRTFGDTTQAGATLTWDEAGAGSAATLAGTRRRVRFPAVARNLDGTGFQLKFSNVRGVAIHRVQAYIEVDGPRIEH